jgi:hypothetical protein
VLWSLSFRVVCPGQTLLAQTPLARLCACARTRSTRVSHGERGPGSSARARAELMAWLVGMGERRCGWQTSTAKLG